MNDIFPIAQTQVNWVEYLNIAKKVFNFPITKSLDRNGMKPDSIAAFIVTLAELQEEIVNPMYALREAGGILKHVSISFLAVAQTDIIMELIQESNLSIMIISLDSGYKAAILSGSLEQWKISIINCTSERVSISLRSLFDKALSHLEKMGLGPLWANFSKISLSDTTFKLIEKK